MNVVYTGDWTDADLEVYLDFCTGIGCPDVTCPVKLWLNESGARTTAHNPGGDASGLFQLMPETAKRLGWNTDTDPHLAAYRALSVSQQLQWAAKYYAPHKGHLGSLGRCYVATFLPVLVDHGDEASFVLCAPQGPFAWAYADNKSFDVAERGFITVQDLVDAAERASAGPRGQELIARIAWALRMRNTVPDREILSDTDPAPPMPAEEA